MRSVGSHSTSGREKDGIKERIGSDLGMAQLVTEKVGMMSSEREVSGRLLGIVPK